MSRWIPTRSRGEDALRALRASACFAIAALALLMVAGCAADSTRERVAQAETALQAASIAAGQAVDYGYVTPATDTAESLALALEAADSAVAAASGAALANDTRGAERWLALVFAELVKINRLITEARAKGDKQ